jgi:signal transduction histidine kinase
MVTLKKQSRNRCLLTVANQGEPISPEDLKQIFKRFYRADKARSTSHSYGLGLSIAQSIVRFHHGKIWAESQGGWNTFFVLLSIGGY